MEEYRNTVIKLHAIYSMIISKFTGNTSKNTSKFTSETNQIRLGGPWGPPYEPLPDCIRPLLPPTAYTLRLPTDPKGKPKGQTPGWGGGEIHTREASQGRVVYPPMSRGVPPQILVNY